MIKVSLPSKDDCTGCGMCSNVCKQQAIKLILKGDGFLYPKIDYSLCILCRACENKCPVNSNIKKDIKQPQYFHYGYSINKEIRMKSSSGGVFAQIAYNFLDIPKSAVVGASLMEDNTVSHILITNKDDIIKLQNTKYIQSYTGNIYSDVRLKIKEGYKILFSGTPCQIYALLCFLNRNEQSQVYTIEVICHGVPSRNILDFALKKNNYKRIISFRNKNEGWGYQSQRTTYINNNNCFFEYKGNNMNNDLFYRLYLSDLFLRKSCYNCSFGNINRTADISIADYWGYDGIEKYNGVSLVISKISKNSFLSFRLLVSHLGICYNRKVCVEPIWLCKSKFHRRFIRL